MLCEKFYSYESNIFEIMFLFSRQSNVLLQHLSHCQPLWSLKKECSILKMYSSKKYLPTFASNSLIALFMYFAEI